MLTDTSQLNPLLLEAARNVLKRRQRVEEADPVELARRAGIDPDPWQQKLLRSTSKQIILLCSRQSGKSTVAAVKALHTALYTAGSLILLLGPSLRQSQELFRKFKFALASLITLPVPIGDESALRVEFMNGSRIVCLPGKEATIRSFSGVTLLVVDEASRVLDDLYNAIRPMLAVSGGRILLLSTPFGKRGFFHREWSQGGDRWERVKITAYDCPRIPKEWLEEERRAIGDRSFRQEYLCEFVDTTDQVFRWEDIQAAVDPSIQPLGWWGQRHESG
ncbi:MAG TPA: phage terminase large subunit [Blastocatellia bacterium]|nr:phage terminase large subunit [Blastocatellia bacterium]